jgi:hypothetical protein
MATNTMMLQITIDHAAIMAWAQRRGARPFTMEGDNHPWPLFFELGTVSPGLIEIDWERFFSQFEQAQLAFVFPVTGPDREMDDTHEFVKRVAVPALMISGQSTIIERVM